MEDIAYEVRLHICCPAVAVHLKCKCTSLLSRHQECRSASFDALTNVLHSLRHMFWLCRTMISKRMCRLLLCIPTRSASACSRASSCSTVSPGTQVTVITPSSPCAIAGILPHSNLCCYLLLQVSHDRVPSARSSARSMHDSYTPMDSPIPGERQVFSRPAEQDHPSSFTQGSFSSGGLPPLPEFPAHSTAAAMESGMSNPLYGEESAADLVDEPEAVTLQGFGQSYAAPIQYDHADEQYGAEPTAMDYSAAAASQDGVNYPEQVAANRFTGGDYSHEQYSAHPTSGLEHNAESAGYSQPPSMLSVPHQVTESIPSNSHTRQLSSFESPSQPAMVSEQPGSRSRSARSTTEIVSPSPTTPGGVDSVHGFQPCHDFVPTYPPASRSQAGTVYQSSRPQSASSVQLASHHSGPTSRRSSDRPMQDMQPAAPVHAMYQEERYGHSPTPAAASEAAPAHARSRGGANSRGGSARSRSEYQHQEEEYSEQYAAPASRPGSAQTRQRGHSRGYPPRPHSPAPGARTCAI